MKISKKIILAIASFVILVLQAFGVKVDVPLVNEIVSAGAGILVMMGIISDTHTSSGSEKKDKNEADGNAENAGSAETPNDVLSENEIADTEENAEKDKVTEEKSSDERTAE